ncbi:Ig heavy chain Mem5-like isoform X1 [Esox lucius]|uniref:Ig heavy chain Mem5-like isoform X1 n=1 Tax=Esox lucius TaxID=8010 RepID=UPI0014770C14|nr:Ig heavy chain Mem5-like isoform X1 [Esox lucius]
MFPASLLLLAAASCVFCQTELTQQDDMTVQPGQSLILSCKVSGYSLTDSSYCTYWVRQPAGKALEWIGGICGWGSTYYSDKLKNKFSSSRDTSSSTVTLTGQRLQTEDTAVYYCARTPNAFDYWGKGTMVTVSSATATAPTLFPLAQCGSGTKDILTLGCMATGFTPPSITFKWNDSTKTALTDYIQYPSVLSNGKYMGVSQLSVKKADWDTKDFVCAVEHSAGNKEVTIRKPGPDADNCKDFSVSVYIPTQEDINEKGVVPLVCLVDSPSSCKFSILWKEGQPPNNNQQENDIDTRDPQKTSTGRYSITSVFNSSKEKWENNVHFSCCVRHLGWDAGTAAREISVSKASEKNQDSFPVTDCSKKDDEEDEFRSLWSTSATFIILFFLSITYSAVISLVKMEQ